MAMACCLLLTRVPLLPLFNVPSLSLCIARLTDRCALFPNLAIMYSFLKRGTRVRPCEPTLFKRKEGARGSKQRKLSSIFLVCPPASFSPPVSSPPVNLFALKTKKSLLFWPPPKKPPFPPPDGERG